MVRWLHIERPCTCTCLCANRPEAFVTDAQTGEYLGKLRDPFACCDLTFAVQDANGMDILKSRGKCCQWGMICPVPCGPCQLIHFPIHDANTDVEVAHYLKSWEWGDFCECFFKEQDNYWVTFGAVSNPKWKALLLALGVFIDIRYFSKRNQNNQGGGGGSQ